MTLTFILAFAIVSLMKLGGEVSRTVLLVGYLLALPAVPLGRFLTKTMLKKTGLWNEPCLIAGTGAQARMIVEALSKDHYLGYTVCGLITMNPADDTGVVHINDQEYLVLGSIGDLPSVLHKYGIRHLVIAAPDLLGPQLVSVVNQVQPYTRSILVVPDLAGIPVIGGEAEYFLTNACWHSEPAIILASRINVIGKRAFDIIAGSLLIMLFLPAQLIAILIRIESLGQHYLFIKAVRNGAI